MDKTFRLSSKTDLLKIARRDFEASRDLLQIVHADSTMYGMWLQQAVEKSLLALKLHLGMEAYAETPLPQLFDDLEQISEIQAFRDLLPLEEYAVHYQECSIEELAPLTDEEFARTEALITFVEQRIT